LYYRNCCIIEIEGYKFISAFALLRTTLLK
jgi:hypothetical protein